MAGAGVDYDAELQLHNEVLRRAYGIRRDDRVLDVGCGTGATTRDAARMAVAGSALGVDISAPMIERARALGKAEGLRNVTFEQADAQVHPFPPDHFDICISRFGTMFFSQPIAAFANIRSAMCPGARLVMMVWQGHDRNEWSVSISRALDGDGVAPPLPPDAPDPFSLSDPRTVEGILDDAGFADMALTEVNEPVYYGRDSAAALAFVRGWWSTNYALESMGPAARERALQRLRETLSSHEGERGVWFDSRAWIVTVIRR
jgi:SAM-dependent methyltransferase